MVGYIAPKNEYKYKGYEINGFLNRFNLESLASKSITTDNIIYEIEE